MATSSRSTADFATNASMPTGFSACRAHEKLSKAGVTITTESAHTAHSVTKLQMNLPRLSRSNNRNHLSWDNSLSCWIHRRGHVRPTVPNFFPNSFVGTNPFPALSLEFASLPDRPLLE